MMAQTVLIVGAWHLGSVVGASLAEFGNSVFLWDPLIEIEKKWRKGGAPIYEPGLDALIACYWQTRLFWCDEIENKVKSCDWIIFAFDTPTNNKDEVKLDFFYETFSEIAAHAVAKNCNFLITSQVPVGTCKKLKLELQRNNPDWSGQFIYQPENLRLGEALSSFRNPDRLVLGVEKSTSYSLVEKQFRDLVQNFSTPIQCMSMESAEMLKHALNSFLATCVVFANELSEICEENGADAWEVVRSLKLDSRVGQKAFLRPGLGFAGGTLARDVKILAKLSEKPADENFFESLYKFNNSRTQWIVKILQKYLKNLEGKKILLLGATYKPNTSTMRRSPAIDLSRILHDLGANCLAMDPKADFFEFESDERETLPLSLINLSAEGFQEVDAAILITEWSEFLDLDWKKIGESMKQPLMIDTKNFLVLPPEFTKIVPGGL